jgi:hypothetical protein
VLLLKEAVKHALRTLRSNKAVLGSIEDSKGDPAWFYLLFFISKSAWPAGASVFISKPPVSSYALIPIAVCGECPIRVNSKCKNGSHGITRQPSLFGCVAAEG